MDKIASDVIVAHGGAGPSIGGRISNRLHGQNSRAWIIGEWNAEALAVGWRNERHPRPARRTQPAGIAERCAARCTQGRQCHIERNAEGGAAESRNAGKNRLLFGMICRKLVLGHSLPSA